MNNKKLIVLAVMALLIGAFFAFDLGQYLSLEYVKAQQAAIDASYRDRPVLTILVYFLVYIAVTGLSLPGATLMTLIGGAVFGLLWGTVIVSFASTIGATVAFLVSRYLLRDYVQTRFRDKLVAVNAGIKKDGAFYLFTLRLVPAFPFFVINLVMGLTPLRTATFFFVSQAGMLAGTIVYINAGTQLGKLESLQGILSPGLLASFVLLGFFPLLAKKIVDYVNARNVLRHYPKPARFDRNVVVIGAGSAGLVTSYIAAAVKAKVTLIEKQRMGGDCLNTGCVPSKALIRSAKFVAVAKRAAEFGITSAVVDFRFADVMARVRRVIKDVEPHDSVERYTALGVECIEGEARITSPYTVKVNGTTLTTRNIVVATGARPFVPPLAGLEGVRYLTSDNVWELRELPRRLVVLGGGPIGCELAQCFARFGSQVTLVESGPRIMRREDEDIAARLATALKEEGIDIRSEHRAQAVEVVAGEKCLVCDVGGGQEKIPFDELLIAVGRIANVKGFGLEELGVRLQESGTLEVNDFLQTNIPTIYACGDVAGPYQFTHAAAHQAWYAAVNALFGGVKRFRVNYSVMPWATFTEPEVARVGVNEQEARAKGIAYEVTTFDISDLDRAIADGEAHGMVKVLTAPGKDRILGATIVGDRAGDLIAEYVMAMKHGIGLNKILGTIHIYPTLMEANKYAAGNWKRAHAPQRLLAWVEKFHAWRRGK